MSTDEPSIPIKYIRAAAYTVLTDDPESDGTLDCGASTLVIVES